MAAMSYRTIVSVINEHTASTVTARYAIALAAACKAGLVLYAAGDDGSDEASLQRTARHQDHLYAVASELGIPVARITGIGNVSKLLPEWLQAEKADLVLYPMIPDKRYGTVLQRQTIRHILRTIRTDLAIMRVITMAKPHPGHILVPLGKVIDDNGRRLMFIAELAKSFQSQVTLFHLSAERDSKGMPDDIIQFGKQLREEHVTVLERRGRGDLGRAITVEAITRHNDLVVLGATGRGALRRLLFGNPAGDIMHKPPCNTILFQAAR
ncbi:MAG: universal stress protein [Geobacteraceae bacterium]|nr:universal stress protein [Geobacteraceae bacterium]